MEIREAIRAGLPRYQPPTADGDVRMTESGEAAEERAGVLNLPKVTVEAKAPPRATEYDFLTPKGRLELAVKRHPGLKVGNLFGLNNGIALAMLQEEIEVEKKSALKEQVERLSIDDGVETRELNRLLREALARPNRDWLKGRSAR